LLTGGGVYANLSTSKASTTQTSKPQSDNTVKAKYLTDSAISFDADGYQQGRGVTVIDYGDTIIIGTAEHLKSELVIEGNRITGPAGWYVTWD